MSAGSAFLRRMGSYLLLLLATAILVGGAMAGHAYLSLPATGFAFGQGDVVGYVQAGGPAAQAGLQVGDQVLAIDGVSPFAGKLYVQPDQTSLTLTIIHEDQAHDVHLALTPPSARNSLEDLSYLVTALAFWVIAVIVLTYKPHGAQAQLLAVQLLLAAITIPVLLLADCGLGWASLFTNTAVLILGWLIVYYHTIFPERIQFAGKRVLLAALAGVGTLLLVAFSWVRLGQHGEWSTSVTAATRAFFVVCVFLGMVLLLRSYKRIASEAGKRQIRVVVLGTALALLPLIAFVLMPQIVPGVSYILIQPAFVALAFIPLSYLYAIRRHDLMRIDHHVSQATVHFLLFVVLCLLYLTISWAVGLPFTPEPQDRSAAGGLAILQHGVAVVGLMASLQPLKVRIERLVHRLLYGSWYDYKSFISCITEELGEATDMDEILDLLVRELTSTMRLRAVALLIADRHGQRAVRLRVARGFDLVDVERLSDDLVELLTHMTEPVEHRALERCMPEESPIGAELAAWAEAGAQMWVPLSLHDKLEGVLVVGPKQADEFLTRTDLDILRTLRRHVAGAIARAAMVEELEGRLRENQELSRRLLTIQKQDRRRIAEEIHNHVIQQIIGARMQLEMAVADGDLALVNAVRKDLQEVVDRLRSVLGDLRPRAIYASDLAERLKNQAATFQRKRDLPVNIHIHGKDDGVPEQVREAIFWVFDEGLTNAWKHAGATQIDASLDIQPDSVHLEVYDDGRGFDMPQYLDGVLADGHLGLMEMREQIALVGGELGIVSAAGQGSRIVADVPLFPNQVLEER